MSIFNDLKASLEEAVQIESYFHCYMTAVQQNLATQLWQEYVENI